MAEQMTIMAGQIREFVIAGHGNLVRVKEMLATEPALLNVSHEWRENDRETAIQGAAHVGNVAIAEYLLERGAPLAICTAAMLGRQREVEALLAEDANLIYATGAHGIPLMAHAALSGDLALVQMLAERGAHEGMSFALHNAVTRRYLDMAYWLLEHGSPDLNWQNFQGKTALALAVERGDQDFIALLRAHGAAG